MIQLSMLQNSSSFSAPVFEAMLSILLRWKTMLRLLWIFSIFLAVPYADATSLGNGPVLLQAFYYLYGAAINVPMDFFNPPQNKNDSVGYRVYTQRNPAKPCFLEPTQEALEKCQIDPKDKLVMLVSGFLEELQPGNLYDVMKDKILANGPFTVIILDWSKYDGPPVSLALHNMKIVGPLAAEMLKFIIKYAGVPPENMILTGHSLGAHLVGYIGRNVPNLGRIDSLDPSWQFMETFPFQSEISLNDAKFVRVLHTSRELTSFGIAKPLGHFDFYVNGGIYQPHCSFGSRYQRTSGDFVTVNNLILKYACPHEIINTYYIYSINSTDCQFLATNCGSYQDFKDGKCPPNSSIVANMGFYGEEIPGLPDNSKFYLDISENPPYCIKDGYISSQGK